MHEEIKRLPYENLKVLVISSRDKLCVNDDIDKNDYQGKLLSQRCNEVTHLAKSARLHSYYKKAISQRSDLPQDLHLASTQLNESLSFRN